MAFLSGWSYRRKITIDQTKIDATLTDFTVLVELTSSNFDFTKALSTGYDIRFTSSDQTTLLEFERDRHDDSGELATYYVKIPSISDSVDTDFYIYYGNALATDESDSVNAWDSNYLAVYHMQDLTGTTIKDSKGNFNGTKSGTSGTPTEVNGQIYKGQDFERSNNQRISVGDLEFTTSSFTVEALINPESMVTGGFNALWITGKTDASGNTNGSNVSLFINRDTDKLGLICASAVANQILNSTASVVISTYQYVAGRGDGSNLKNWVDGNTVSVAQTVTPTATTNDRKIGQAGSFIGTTSPFDGIIDEMRFSTVARSDAWIDATRDDLANNLVSYGTEELNNERSEDEVLEISDSIDVQDTSAQNTETLEISDSIQVLDTSILATESLEVSDSINVSIVSLNQDASFATRILSYNPIVFVTNTNPAEIVKIDTTDPENLTWQIVEITGLSYAIDAQINETTEFVYVAGSNGMVAKIDLNDLYDQTLYNVSDSDDLVTLDLNENQGLIYVGTENAVGELYLIDERENFLIDTDLQVLAPEEFIIDTDFECIEAFLIDTDIQVLSEETFIIDTDFKCLTAALDTITPIKLEDFVVYVDNVQLANVDVILDSIRIDHSVDEKSVATFRLTRNHDNLNQDRDGNTRTITNQNTVKITIQGITEFEGKISRISPNYSSTDDITVTALQANPGYNYQNKVLSLPSLNSRLGLYDILVQNPDISNPYIDPEDPNPEKFKGIFVQLGKKNLQQVQRYTQIDATGSFAERIQNGTFNLRQNWTYFWSPTVTNFNPNFDLGSTRTITFSYIGTSLAPVSSDLWLLERANHRYQRIYPNQVQRLGDGKVYTQQLDDLNIGSGSSLFSLLQSGGWINGSGEVQDTFKRFIFDSEEWNINLSDSYKKVLYDYMDSVFGIYIGQAPYQTVSTRNDVFVSKFRWEDRNDGLYSVQDESYDFTEYAELVGNLEYEKLLNINGDILPDTSCSSILTIDAYYYFGLELLNRINVDNTLVANTFNNANGFPLAIKGITITASDRKINLRMDNRKSNAELEEIDGQYPSEEDYINKEKLILVAQKSDMNTRLRVE